MLDDPFEELKAEVAELLRASICIVDTYKREAALSIKSKLFSVFTGIVMGLIAVALLYSAASMFLHSRKATGKTRCCWGGRAQTFAK